MSKYLFVVIFKTLKNKTPNRESLLKTNLKADMKVFKEEMDVLWWLK